jgi:hypothetical protein
MRHDRVAGINPAEKRRAEKYESADTFEAVARQWLPIGTFTSRITFFHVGTHQLLELGGRSSEHHHAESTRSRGPDFHP